MSLLTSWQFGWTVCVCVCEPTWMYTCCSGVSEPGGVCAARRISAGLWRGELDPDWTASALTASPAVCRDHSSSLTHTHTHGYELTHTIRETFINFKRLRRKKCFPLNKNMVIDTQPAVGAGWTFKTKVWLHPGTFKALNIIKNISEMCKNIQGLADSLQTFFIFLSLLLCIAAAVQPLE